MKTRRNVIGLALAGLSVVASGCIGGAEAKTPSASPRVEAVTAAHQHAPQRVARWRFSSVVEHGPAGWIGSNAQWELSVFEHGGERVARLSKLTVDDRPVEPADELSAEFEFTPRPLDERELATVAGSPWEAAQVVETELDLQGPFRSETMLLRVWFTADEIAGVWLSGRPQTRGGALAGSARAAQPAALRDVEALPCALKCQALGDHESDACTTKCLPRS